MDTITYCQHVITRAGALRQSMYSAGPCCATIELARECRGDAHARLEDGERYAIVARRTLPGTWTDSAGHAHPRYDRPVVVEIIA